MKKEKFNNNYIYPPRPELKISSDNLNFYDKNIFLAQPKLNGSCCEIYTSKTPIQKNRHNSILNNFNLSNREIINVFGTNLNLIIGEYMNKSKNSEIGLFNHKFVIFDQIVIDGEYLLGSTFEERINILNELYTPISETKYLYKISDNIYMVKTFYKNFKRIWDDIVKIDMYEGLVLKKKDGKLERGSRKINNNKTQLKCRKETKLYNY